MSRGEQLARQWQLLKVLERHRYGISLDDLALQLECTRRTIERDLKALKDIGFPLQSETSDNGKKLWNLPSKFTESNNLVVNPTEIISLSIANQLINPLAGTYLGDGWEQFLTKIQSILPRKALDYFSELEDTFFVKHTHKSTEVSAKCLETIRTAIKEHKTIKIDYARDGGKRGFSAALSPYGLILYESAFYVVGYSEEVKDIRTYKLQRLKKVELTTETFQTPQDFSLEACFKESFGIINNKGKNRTTIRCEMKDWAARLVREQRWHITQVNEKDDGDTVIVSFLLDSTIEFKRWILGFGPQAKVLEPQKIRQEIINSLTETLADYMKKP